MTGNRVPFGPDELPMASGESPADLAMSLRIGRELDTFAADATIDPSDDFATRVMAAVAQEPAPRPVAAVGRALRGGRPLGILAGLRDVWRVATTGDRPALVRAQAFAFVLLVFVAVGSVGGLAGAAALGLFDPSVAPSPSPQLTTPSPSPAPSVSPSPAPSVSPSPSPSETVEPSPSETVEPRGTQAPSPTETDDHGGRDGGGGSGSGSASGIGKGSGSGD